MPWDYTDITAKQFSDRAKQLLADLIPGGQHRADEIGQVVDAIVIAAVFEGAAREVYGIRVAVGLAGE